MDDPERWTIRLFGGLECARGADVMGPLSAKHAEVLAFLACYAATHPDWFIPRDRVIELFWPDSEADNLDPALSRIRGALKSPAATPNPVIEVNDGSVRLNPALVRIDLSEFLVAVYRAQRAQSDSIRANHLVRAVKLYRGDLIPETRSEWPKPDRKRSETQYLLALYNLALLYRDVGRAAETSVLLRRIQAIEPMHTEAAVLLAKLYDAEGHRALAIREIRSALESWPAEPGARFPGELTDLLQSFDGNVRPETVSTHSDPALNGRLPPVDELFSGTEGHTVGFRSLPAIARVFGRTADVAMCQDAVIKNPFVVLTGPPVVGKSTVSIVTAQSLRTRFADGVVFVPLGRAETDIDVITLVAAGLGIDRAHDEAGVLGFMADLDVLLVLDNCEHVREACERLSAEIGSRCPGIHILATSQVRFGAPLAKVLRIEPLSRPAESDFLNIPSEPVGWLLSYSSGQLLVDRAKSLRSGFSITPDNARDLARICTLVDGIPLSLELAANALCAAEPAVVADGLAKRILELAGGQSTSAPYHISLRATMDRSFELLDDETRLLFCRLAIFRGSWTMPEASSVCFQDDNPYSLFARLSRLESQSLITVEQNGYNLRYSLLETIRAYAEDRWKHMEADLIPSVSSRHAAYFGQLVVRTRGELRTESQIAATRALSTELLNIRAALVWFATSHEKPNLFLEAVGNLCPFWIRTGRPQEGYDWNVRALECTSNAPSGARALALGTAGYLGRVVGQYAEANNYFGSSHDVYVSIKDLSGTANILNDWGVVAQNLGENARARSRYLESRNIQLQLANPRGAAMSSGNLAILSASEGDFEAAIAHYRDALAGMEQVGDLRGQAMVHLGLSEMQLKAGRTQEGFAHLGQAWMLTDPQDVWVRLVGIESIASWCGTQGLVDAAAMLWGFTTRHRDQSKIVLTPSERTELQAEWDNCRALNAIRFEQKWQEGMRLRREEIEQICRSVVTTHTGAAVWAGS